MLGWLWALRLRGSAVSDLVVWKIKASCGKSTLAAVARLWEAGGTWGSWQVSCHQRSEREATEMEGRKERDRKRG